MGFLTIGFFVAILCCQIQAAPMVQKTCPNDFSHILGDKCYSLHTELDFHYKDAIDHCQEHGGTLWSQENDKEVEFLRKIKAKESFHYWVGAKGKGDHWEYLSDGSQVSTSLIQLKTKSSRCLAVGLSKDKLIPFNCHHNLYTICEYTGEVCENRKDEDQECNEIITKEEDFESAEQTCRLSEGRIAEVKNEKQLSKLMELIRKDKFFESLSEDKLNKLDGSRFPILWHLNDQLKDEKLCGVFEDWKIKTINCTGIHNFVCKFDAINSPTNTFAVDKSKSNRHTTQKLDEQEVSEEPQKTEDIEVSNVSSITTALIVVTVILSIVLVAVVLYMLHLRRRTNTGRNPGGEQEPLQ